MAYTIKQIKKILNVQEFVAMSNTLSKVYLDFENKEYFIDTFTDRERIYKFSKGNSLREGEGESLLLFCTNF